MHLVRSGDPTTATKNGPRSPPSCAVGLIKRDGQTDGDAMPTALHINVQATNYTIKIQVAAHTTHFLPHSPFVLSSVGLPPCV